MIHHRLIVGSMSMNKQRMMEAHDWSHGFYCTLNYVNAVLFYRFIFTLGHFESNLIPETHLHDMMVQ